MKTFCVPMRITITTFTNVNSGFSRSKTLLDGESFVTMTEDEILVCLIKDRAGHSPQSIASSTENTVAEVIECLSKHRLVYESGGLIVEDRIKKRKISLSSRG